MRALVMLSLVLAAGCSKSEGEHVSRRPKASTAPGRTSRPTPSPEAAGPKAVERPFVVVAIQGGDGDLAQLLATHAAAAKRAKLTPYIEFTADWCKPCVAFKKHMGDPLMED